MALGEHVELGIFAPNPGESFAFYERLGFKRSSGSRLTDGNITLRILEGSARAADLLYFSDSAKPREFQDPSGQRIIVAPTKEAPVARTTLPFMLGEFGEFSIPVNDLKVSASFWEKLGFERIAGHDSDPYAWGVWSDRRMLIGLHQTKFEKPNGSITYFAADMPDRLRRLRQEGGAPAKEYKNEKGSIEGGLLLAPEGTRINLFTGDISGKGLP